MQRTGFQFKQFYIEHTGCAMKVGTDSIMLGSWVKVGTEQHILDIGTGSGLLAIMLAQKALRESRIVGIDIDPQAIDQAKINAGNCPWLNQLSFQLTSLQKYDSDVKYDLIVCNPPYFVNNQAANRRNLKFNNQRIMARQTTELSHTDLLTYVARKLAKQGRFCCVLPADIGNKFIALATDLGLYCDLQMAVHSKPNGKVIRYLYQFSTQQNELSVDSITIHNVNGSYSVDYQNLCKEYYLNF